jgi:two-component system sensor histidine kinase KdpD
MADNLNKDESIEKFYQLIQKSRRGNLKVYIGLAAGVGKTYKMLLEARQLLDKGIDVVIGYIETHGRLETEKLLENLPLIPREKIFYKGRELEEMNTDAILIRRPEVVIVDELAHTNVPGSKHEKRYQDVEELLFNGINVISAINIQHIDSLNTIVEEITGIKVKETIPDNILGLADEVVNIDLTADELIQRLKEGKIYKSDKIQTALTNFFKKEHLLQLREIALREVANALGKKISSEVSPLNIAVNENLLVCMGSDPEKNEKIIRRAARTAGRFDNRWYAVYVDTPNFSFEKMDLKLQRYLINNFKLASELGAVSEKIQAENIVEGIMNYVKEKEIDKIIIGKPSKKKYLKKFLHEKIIDELLDRVENEEQDIDVEIIA